MDPVLHWRGSSLALRRPIPLARMPSRGRCAHRTQSFLADSGLALKRGRWAGEKRIGYQVRVPESNDPWAKQSLSLRHARGYMSGSVAPCPQHSSTVGMSEQFCIDSRSTQACHTRTSANNADIATDIPIRRSFPQTTRWGILSFFQCLARQRLLGETPRSALPTSVAIVGGKRTPSPATGVSGDASVAGGGDAS